LIILAYAFDLVEPAIIIASLLSQEKSIFKIPDPIESYEYKDYYSNGYQCDFITAYFAYVFWFTKFYKEYTFNANNRIIYNEYDEEKRECKNLNLNYYVVKETKVLSFDILKRMRKIGFIKTEELGFNVKKLNIKNNLDDILFLKIVFAGAFYGKMMRANYINPEMIKKRLEDKDRVEKTQMSLGNRTNDEFEKASLEDRIIIRS